MPAGKVTVKAVFMDDNTMLNFFTDVHAEDYYYDAVFWAAQKGITGGMSDTLFAPNAACPRAQIVTFLWRAAGSPEPKSTNHPFADVPSGSYYEKAVLWAVENGITEARVIQRLHPASSAREHKAQRSCTVRQAVRQSAAARPSPMYLPMPTMPMRQHGQSRRASPAASETVCSARITTALVHRSSRSCTDCTAANKQINRIESGAGEYPCRRLFTDFLPPSHAFGASCIPGQIAAIRAGETGKMS